MRRHFDVHEFGRHVREAGDVLPWHSGKHHFFAGIFVIDAEKTARPAVIEREEGDVIVVVAELPELRRGALLARIEGRRVREEGIAPAKQNLRIEAFGEMMLVVDSGPNLVETKPRFGSGGVSAPQKRGAKEA
jgi:hypothetical protein